MPHQVIERRPWRARCCADLKFFLSSVTAGRVCTAPRDRLEGWHERDASTPRGGSFDLFKTQRAVRDRERTV